MNSAPCPRSGLGLIFRVIAKVLVPILHLVALWILFRGHNAPGGGFIAGLVSAAAFIIQALALGIQTLPRTLLHKALPLAGVGLFLSFISGLLGLPAGKAFLTGVWKEISFGTFKYPLGSPVLFDLGVFLVVVSVVSIAVFSLLKCEEEGR